MSDLASVIKSIEESVSKFPPESIRPQLEDALNKRPKGESPGTIDGEQLPAVPHPPSFRPEPEVIGGKHLLDALTEIYKIAPELRGQFKSIGYAPTHGVFQDMDRSKIPVQNYAHTTLMGLTDRHGPSPTVYINPSLDNDPDELKYTVGHELDHTLGHGETDARLVEALLKRQDQLNRVEQGPTDPDPLSSLVDALQKRGIKAKLE